MQFEQLRQTMEDNADRIRLFASKLPPEQARWKPDPATWSALEVVHHLYDEERLDFRVRLEIVLHHPQDPWPPIDPEGWVVARCYNEQDPDEILRGFLSERLASLTWLEGLGSPDWEATYAAPFGTIRAGDLFAAWVAHDLLHIRQLVELHWARLVQAAAPYDVRYAGTW